MKFDDEMMMLLLQYKWFGVLSNFCRNNNKETTNGMTNNFLPFIYTVDCRKVPTVQYSW
jgi:hypothetical protein